jgi:hypothetical protein
MDALKRKLESLVPESPIYLHPKSAQESADFGIFNRINSAIGERHIREDHLNFKQLLSFTYSENYGLWVPSGSEAYEFLGIAIPTGDILSGKYSLYVGLPEIQTGMEKNNNPNYNLVEAILKNI